MVLKSVLSSCISLDKTFRKRTGDDKAAIIYSLLSILVAFLLNCYVKFSPLGKISDLTIMLRGLGGFLFSHTLQTISGKDTDVPTSVGFKKLCIRNSLVVSSLAFQLVAIKLIPLSEVMLIVNCIPIFSYLWNFLLFGEKIHRKEFFSLVLSFTGMFLILAPSLFQSEPASESMNHYAKGMSRLLYQIVLIACVILQALGQVLTKYLVDVNVVQISANLNIYFFVIACMHQILFGTEYTLSALEVAVGLLTLGTGFSLNLYLYFHSLMIGKPPRVSMANYLGVVLSYFLEIIILKEMPYLLTVVGTILIVVGLSLILLK